jgi:hypothetical protein
MMRSYRNKLDTVREKKTKGRKSYIAHKENKFSHHVPILIIYHIDIITSK